MMTFCGRRGAAILLAIATMAGGVAAVATVMIVQEFPGIPVAPPAFTFAAAGDLGYTNTPDVVALARRVAAANASFLLALGDLGYRPDEAAWCASIKGAFNDVEVMAGNHDTNETPGGDIARYVAGCPFTLSVGLTGNAITPGYGYEYYFDYPAVAPLARFILISPGVEGTLGYNFSAGSVHAIWVESAVDDARARGIPWVIVGMHKQCITVGEKTYCEMGKAIFNELVSLKVDLILQAHDHVYERSKQLALQTGCSSVRSDGDFNAACIVAEPQNDTYAKGLGSVVVVQGVGGRSQDNVTLNGSDPELGYFASVMGGNANTQNRSGGSGSVRYAVTRERIEVETDFCPDGSPGEDGSCPARAVTTFHDRFAIVLSPSLSPSTASGLTEVLARVVALGPASMVVMLAGVWTTNERRVGGASGPSVFSESPASWTPCPVPVVRERTKTSIYRHGKVYERWIQWQSG